MEVTGEIYKAIDVLQAWANWANLESDKLSAHRLLAVNYRELGLYAKALEEFRVNAAMAPSEPLAQHDLGAALLVLGRYDEAASIFRNPDLQGWYFHRQRYYLSLLRSDEAGATAQLKWMEDNAADPLTVGILARIDLSGGKLRRARQRAEHAADIAIQSNRKEMAALQLLRQATGDALVGDSVAARKTVTAALKLADERQKNALAAFILALSGESTQAKSMIDRVVRENPSDTLLNAVDVPVVLAVIELQHGNSQEALRLLEATGPFEFGQRAELVPNYLRGLAYLRARKPDKAAFEFQSVLDHRGVSPVSVVWVLAHVGLARANAMAGEENKARSAYQQFFTLWKDADPDIPILKQAKAEYASLH
jgi:tetratricopeptide (TPR) repeat protein